MKKSLALILAAMMVAGTASVAFAVEPSDVRMGDQVYVWDTDESAYIAKDKDGTVEYGDKIAFELTDEAGTAVITDSDEVKNLKAYPEYKVGEGLVAEKPTIVYKKVYTAPVAEKSQYELKNDPGVVTIGDTSGLAKVLYDADSSLNGKKIKLPSVIATLTDEEIVKALGLTGENISEVLASSAAKAALLTHIKAEGTYNKVVDTPEVKGGKAYRYVIELQLKDSTSTASKDFFGEMYVGRTSNGAKDERALSFNLTVSNDKDDQTDADYFEVKGKENWVIDFDDSDVCDIEFMSENGNTSYALFTVDASGQGKENVGFSVKYNSEIAAKYPEANLEFIKFTATPTFNRTGELWIYADEDSYIYEVTADGLKEIKNAEYDESAEAWYIKTRTLKSYVTSDVELDVTASSSSSEDASSSGTSSSNPTTGGTTGTTGGNPGDKYNPNTGR